MASNNTPQADIEEPNAVAVHVVPFPSQRPEMLSKPGYSTYCPPALSNSPPSTPLI
jgi:hypothetical protein